MRKIMLLAAMLAMVLAAAAPAFAQAVVEDDGDDGNVTTTVIDCSQVQAAVANQGQYGDANAAADDGSLAVAGISQELGITQNQVNACLGEIGTVAQGGEDGGIIVEHSVHSSATSSATASAPSDDSASSEESSDDSAAAAEESSDEAAAAESSDEAAAAATEGELPETGGASLLALGAGALLVAGGLLARRIVR